MFLYICGEWTCSPPSTDGAAFELGGHLNANLFALEHRFYGNSTPFHDDLSNATSYENLKFLNSTQALEDIAQFIQFINARESPRIFQWVVIGGSYPGALSAWFKSQYPDLAVAAWSSSGVIRAIEDYAMFDYDIYEVSKSYSDECADQVKNITETIEHVFLHGTPDEKSQMLE